MRLETGHRIASNEQTGRGGRVKPMSALGQNRTFASQKAMSALLLIATTKADIRKPPCLVYPQKRTCAVQWLMSAKGQKRTSPLTARNGIKRPSPRHALEAVNAPFFELQPRSRNKVATRCRNEYFTWLG